MKNRKWEFCPILVRNFTKKTRNAHPKKKVAADS
jgi:hypothetical protein